MKKYILLISIILLVCFMYLTFTGYDLTKAIKPYEIKIDSEEFTTPGKEIIFKPVNLYLGFKENKLRIQYELSEELKKKNYYFPYILKPKFYIRNISHSGENLKSGILEQNTYPIKEMFFNPDRIYTGQEGYVDLIFSKSEPSFSPGDQLLLTFSGAELEAPYEDMIKITIPLEMESKFQLPGIGDLIIEKIELTGGEMNLIYHVKPVLNKHYDVMFSLYTGDGEEIQRVLRTGGYSSKSNLTTGNIKYMAPLNLKLPQEIELKLLKVSHEIDGDNESAVVIKTAGK